MLGRVLLDSKGPHFVHRRVSSALDAASCLERVRKSFASSIIAGMRVLVERRRKTIPMAMGRTNGSPLARGMRFATESK